MESTNINGDNNVADNSQSQNQNQETGQSQQAAVDNANLSLSDRARLMSGESVRGSSDVKPQGNEKNKEKKPDEPIGNKKKYKIKVDGEEFEEELNLDDEEAIRRHLQFSRVARKRIEEMQSLKQNTAAFFNQLKSDPWGTLSDQRFGIDLRKIAEEKIAEDIRLSMMTEEQKKLHDYEKMLAREKQREEQERIQKEKEIEERNLNFARNHFEKIIVEALTEVDKDLKSPSTVKRMAQLMERNLELGLELTPRQLAQLVKEEELENEKRYQARFATREEEKKKREIEELKNNPKFGKQNDRREIQAEKTLTFEDPMAYAERIMRENSLRK